MSEFCAALLQLLPEETQEGNLQKLSLIHI